MDENDHDPDQRYGNYSNNVAPATSSSSSYGPAQPGQAHRRNWGSNSTSRGSSRGRSTAQAHEWNKKSWGQSTTFEPRRDRNRANGYNGYKKLDPKKEFLQKVFAANGAAGPEAEQEEAVGAENESQSAAASGTAPAISPGLQKFFESIAGNSRGEYNQNEAGAGTHNQNQARRQNSNSKQIEEEAHPRNSSSSSGGGRKVGKALGFGPGPAAAENRREVLTEGLSNCSFECMICCGKVYERQSIWNCQSCYNAFHLHCIKKWVDSSAVQEEWRCPGCQNIVNSYPKFYYCFCGKSKNPPFNSSGLPHSCGNSCGRRKVGGPDCQHLCTLPCHPGPCEDCTDIVKRTCSCGKSSAFVQCQSKNAVLCGQICGKNLNCGVHSCKQTCHSGSCSNCEEKLYLECHCGISQKEIFCSIEGNQNYRPKYSCDLVCNKLLNCKIHRCASLCHPNPCEPCSTSLDVIVSCPCGQTPITEACRLNNLPLRKSCKDPIPNCNKKCGKILPCGINEKQRHRCTNNCHSEKETPCHCPLSTTVRCRCGNQEIEMSCSTYVPGAEVLCKKKCSKKRQCGRHKCNTACCIDMDHICPVICDRLLSCQTHRCQQLCHNGHCNLCHEVSFEELRCRCGESVHYPPVPCGTAPPTCSKPCSREHDCSHPIHHNCHSEATCPPCTFLTEKWCHGKHELRKNIPCFNTNVSCGFKCLKMLKCGKHDCQKICHPGSCERPDEICRMPCTKRIKCGHNCSAPCHDGECPETICKKMTEVSCPCGRRKEVMLCWKREIEYEKALGVAVSAAVAQSNDPFDDDEESNESGEGISKIDRITERVKKTKNPSVVLKCDKECSRVERTRKMAEALQLDNPDPETRLGPPNYSDLLKKFAQKSPQFIEMVHEKLTSLVIKTKKSSQKNHTYAFDSMNRDKRTVIHEYSDHFGVQSESFDEEPNRNVVVTASKDRCWLPSVSLIDVVYRKPIVREAERKNVYQDLELAEPRKTKIWGPANMKFK